MAFDAYDDDYHEAKGNLKNSKIPMSHNHGLDGDYMDTFTEEEGMYYESEEMKQARYEADQVATRRVQKLMELAKEKLTERQFEVFTLLTGTQEGNEEQENLAISPLSQQEVARRLGISQQAVSNTFARCLEILREHEGAVFEEEEDHAPSEYSDDYSEDSRP